MPHPWVPVTKHFQSNFCKSINPTHSSTDLPLNNSRMAKMHWTQLNTTNCATKTMLEMHTMNGRFRKHSLSWLWPLGWRGLAP